MNFFTIVAANNDISHATVWRLAAPIILSNLSIPLVGIVDTAVMGHLHDAASIGAVAMGALVFSFVYWGFSFLRMGTTGLISQVYGSDDNDGIIDTLHRAIIVAVVIGVLLVLLQSPIIQFSLYVLDGGSDVKTLTGEYLNVRIWSAPATLVQYVLIGSLIGLHNTRAVLVVQLLLNGLNVVLDLIFVAVFKWGIIGVALASVVAEYSATVLGVWFLIRNTTGFAVVPKREKLLNGKMLKKMLGVNTNILLRTLLLVFSFAYFTTQSARLGVVTLAANAILMNLQSLLAYGLDGFAHAVEALTGSAYGAANLDRLRRAIRLTTIWALITGILISIAYWLGGEYMIALMTDIESVQEYASTYLVWIVISPLISVWSFQLDGIFIGTTHTSAMRNAMMASTLVYLLSVQLLLPWLGNHGLWLALSIFMLARAMTLFTAYTSIEKSLIALTTDSSSRGR